MDGKVTVLESWIDEDGCECTFTRATFPWPMSNRCFISTNYSIPMEDGSFALVCSGMYNDKLSEQKKDVIKKDVYAKVRF